MRAADLKRAQALVARRETLRAMAERIAAGERLRFVLGDGDKASEIVASAAYAGQIAADLGRALALGVESLTAELRELGVDD